MAPILSALSALTLVLSYTAACTRSAVDELVCTPSSSGGYHDRRYCAVHSSEKPRTDSDTHACIPQKLGFPAVQEVLDGSIDQHPALRGV